MDEIASCRNCLRGLEIPRSKPPYMVLCLEDGLEHLVNDACDSWFNPYLFKKEMKVL